MVQKYHNNTEFRLTQQYCIIKDKSCKWSDKKDIPMFKLLYKIESYFDNCTLLSYFKLSQKESFSIVFVSLHC